MITIPWISKNDNKFSKCRIAVTINNVEDISISKESCETRKARLM